jgi:hypothetical protein
MPEQKRATRLEEQIREILEQAEREPGWRRWLRRLRHPRPQLRVIRWRVPQQRPVAIEPAWVWLGATFGLAFLALLVADWSRTLAILLAISCLIVFFLPVVARFRRSSETGSSARRWRGRDIDLPPPSSGLAGRLRTWWWHLRHRR